MAALIDTIDWDKTPLVPAIAQDQESGDVLMLAYMNEEALHKTLTTRKAHYFSRSRQRLWMKGEESGNVQDVSQVLLDCDSDTILVKVKQHGGVACHTGRPNCFFKDLLTDTVATEPVQDMRTAYSIVDRLYHTVQERRHGDPGSSYVAKLFSKGDTVILKKVIEEAGELALAIKDKDTDEAVYEAADLMFHSLIALASLDISPDRVKQELARREGLSGIDEKNSRSD